MIVRACDTCRKLLAEPGSCVVIAIRRGSSLAFQKADKSVKGASHFCSQECSETYFLLWLSDSLPEIEQVEEVEAPAEPQLRVSEVVLPPDPEDVAIRNQLLNSILR